MSIEVAWQKRFGEMEFCVAFGSVLEFQGDAIVNAANEGCCGGFGVDEVINQAGGPQLKIERKKLNGCPTGSAKITPSFQHSKVKWIIHAVGPVYRIPFGMSGNTATLTEFLSKKDELLESAYSHALQRGKEKDSKSIGFCLLSAGVFRGERSLFDIITISLTSIIGHSYEGLEKVVIFAFTTEEKETILAAVEKLWPEG